jgi:hypothetical protein
LLRYIFFEKSLFFSTFGFKSLIIKFLSGGGFSTHALFSPPYGHFLHPLMEFSTLRKKGPWSKTMAFLPINKEQNRVSIKEKPNTK